MAAEETKSGGKENQGSSSDRCGFVCVRERENKGDAPVAPFACQPSTLPLAENKAFFSGVPGTPLLEVGYKALWPGSLLTRSINLPWNKAAVFQPLVALGFSTPSLGFFF